MKALFAIKNAKTQEVVKELHFESKPEAKQYRNKLWEDAGSPKKDNGTPAFPFTVTYGKDHDLYRR